MKSKAKPQRVDEMVWVAIHPITGDVEHTVVSRSEQWLRDHCAKVGWYTHRIARCRLQETKPKRKTK